MHLAMIVANLGRFCHIGGCVARTTTTYVIITDHRLTPHERVQFVNSHIDMADVASADVTVLTDIDFDCAADVHQWVAVDRGAATFVEARCEACGAVDLVPPFPTFETATWCAPKYATSRDGQDT